MGMNGHELPPRGAIADGRPDGASTASISSGVSTARAGSRTGRPPTHSLTALRKAVTRLGTKRLDQRSAVAVAVRRFKADLTADLGGDLSRAQATVIELAARTWLMVEALDDWLLRQPSLVLHRPARAPATTAARRLAGAAPGAVGLKRKVRDVPSLATYLTTKQSPFTDGGERGCS